MTRILWILLVILVACDRGDQPAPPELTVFAASSLREAFSALSRDFEAAHPGVRVHLAFAGSQELRTQLEHGAAADVFASADWAQMEPLRRAALVNEPQVFARNELVLIVRPEAAADVRTLAELPAARRIVLGGPEVPVGRYTGQLLQRADQLYGGEFQERVMARVVSRESNVRQVASKLRLGEADAAIVYRSDVPAAGPEVVVRPVPTELSAAAEYPVAILAAARQAALAAEWVSSLRGPAGARALEAAGLRPAVP